MLIESESPTLRIWNLLPDKIKKLVEVYTYKKEIKKWKPNKLPMQAR